MFAVVNDEFAQLDKGVVGQPDFACFVVFGKIVEPNGIGFTPDKTVTHRFFDVGDNGITSVRACRPKFPLAFEI